LAASLVSPRGFGRLQFAGALLGVWVIISPFILDAKFSIAARCTGPTSVSGDTWSSWAGGPGHRAPGAR